MKRLLYITLLPLVIFASCGDQQGATVPTVLDQPELNITNEKTTTKAAIDMSQPVVHEVPFSPQAPFGDWSNPIIKDGCEESSVLMAMHWVNGKALTPEVANKEILAMGDYQVQLYGSHKDTDVEDTAKRLIEGYYDYKQYEVLLSPTVEDIKYALYEGSVVIAPMAGRKLGNPYFKTPGPEKHMLVISGYNPNTKQFITQEPGTRRGENYTYNEKILMTALHNYPTTGASESNAEQGVIIVNKN